jgi:RES domain-containing protein
MHCKGWRLVRRHHIADAFSGIGCDFADGRWHTKGNRLVYASESLSTAMLELLAHGESFTSLQQKFVAFSFSVSGEHPVEWSAAALEERTPLWRSPVPVSFTQQSGDRWILTRSTLLLRVPSAVVPVYHNLLINPAHAHFSKLNIEGPFEVPVDVRLIQTS